MVIAVARGAYAVVLMEQADWHMTDKGQIDTPSTGTPSAVTGSHKPTPSPACAALAAKASIKRLSDRSLIIIDVPEMLSLRLAFFIELKCFFKIPIDYASGNGTNAMTVEFASAIFWECSYSDSAKSSKVFQFREPTAFRTRSAICRPSSLLSSSERLSRPGRGVH
jgi:hypothetical protein